MSQTQKTTISLAVFILTVLVFMIFIVYPLFNEIKKGSRDILAPKNTLAELETKAKNIQKYQIISKGYEQNLAKIDALFVNQAEPINFIEFLEKTASQSRLSIEISPLAQTKEEGIPWPSMNFQLTLTGSFPDLLRFLEKLESSPYLIEILNLNMRRLNEWDVSTGKFKGMSVGDINAPLSIKVYTQ